MRNKYIECEINAQVCAAASWHLVSFLKAPVCRVINILHVSAPRYEVEILMKSASSRNFVDPFSVRRNCGDSFRIGTGKMLLKPCRK
jgi:hypothetical protein